MSLVYIVAIMFAKISVLLLYLRFFRIVDLTRRLIWIGLAMTLVTSAAFIVTEIMQAVRCMGFSALTNSFCISVSKITLVQAVVNVLLDFYILVIPLQQVYKLRVDARKKLGVAAVFGVGFM
jgi:hypothetical protein